MAGNYLDFLAWQKKQEEEEKPWSMFDSNGASGSGLADKQQTPIVSGSDDMDFLKGMSNNTEYTNKTDRIKAEGGAGSGYMQGIAAIGGTLNQTQQMNYDQLKELGAFGDKKNEEDQFKRKMEEDANRRAEEMLALQKRTQDGTLGLNRINQLAGMRGDAKGLVNSNWAKVMKNTFGGN
jgi:hypothetical protein